MDQGTLPSQTSPVLSILSKIPEILVGIQMERFIFGFFLPEYLGSPLGSGGGPHICRSIYDKPALCPIKFGNSEGIVPI